MPVTQTPETITARDGFELAATRFRPDGAAHSAILVAGATAVPQGFYRRFALAAAERGFEVLTMDYRGTGASRPANLRGFRMDFTDWARLDMDAALDALSVGAHPTFLVGHSYGGMAFGLVPRTERVRGVYAFGIGTGWHGFIPPAERVRVRSVWNVVGPVLTTTTGYLPWSRLMSGEDLPSDIFWQWRRWCSRRFGLLDDPKLPGVRDEYARVTTPMVLANASDDLWAPPAARDAIMSGYTSAPWRSADIDVASRGVGRLGHMGYFRESAQPLWDDVFTTFDELRRQQEPAPR